MAHTLKHDQYACNQQLIQFHSRAGHTSSLDTKLPNQAGTFAIFLTFSSLTKSEKIINFYQKRQQIIIMRSHASKMPE